MVKTIKKTAPALPEGIIAEDLKHPHSGENVPNYGTKAYDKWIALNREVDSFELWYTERFGWCIPTLLIRRAGSRRPDSPDRTYATTLDGQPVRMGLGPHVLAQRTIYVRASRLAQLQKFLDIRTAGQATSGDIRDRISTRRAQSAMRSRSSFMSGWGF